MRMLPMLFPFLLFNMTCHNRSQSSPIVLIQTELGDVVAELFLYKAPITASNFLCYVDENRFEGAAFYRVVRLDNQPENDVRIEVVQGGLGFVESGLRLPPIIHETTDKTGVLHKDGVVSMARREPGTASSEFFICIGDQPELDYGGNRNPDGQGFAAFGRIMQGMDVIRAIQQQPARGQMLVSPVRIISVRRITRALVTDPCNHGASR